MKGIVEHKESNTHKEMVDHREMEDYLNEIWFRVEIVGEVSQIPI